MFITMHCMGLPFNGETIKHKSLGGSESAAYYMAKELAAQGHKVTLFTNHPEEGVFDDVRYVYSGQSTEVAPLGERFHHYAANTPNDVLIIQRIPDAFNFKWASKVNLLWLHDLALKRYQPAMQNALHNITGILTVSEFHKQQVCDVYGVNPDIVYPITNGVDLSIYDDAQVEAKHEEFNLDPEKEYIIYSSRPERGLEYLVRPHGIMHTLHEEGKNNIHLLVCGYDNTTQQMAPLYNQLWEACDVLPNVTNLGALTKQQLARVQTLASVHVYPTTFEEVSCITAMECMAAGLPFLSSKHAALPETCENREGCKLLPLQNGEVNIHRFIKQLKYMMKPQVNAELSIKQRSDAGYYSWYAASQRLNAVIETVFSKKNPDAVLRHLIRMSDIYAANKFIIDQDDASMSPIAERCVEELNECYKFAWEDTFDEHYKAMYVREEERGIHYGPEELAGNNRFEQVSKEIAALPAGAVVMDYGCAHGHYTVNLAKRFPDKEFVGVDIALSNVEKARKWAADEAVENVSFVYGRISLSEYMIIDFEASEAAEVNGPDTARAYMAPTRYDAIIAAEVIEHVAEPGDHVDVLHQYLNENGILVITTPYGPWEAIGYREHHPWRAHLWHFERADIHELWGHFNDFRVVCAPSNFTKEGDAIGSYITTFKQTNGASTGPIDYARKFRETMPRETVSLCMIVKDAESSLHKTLDSLVEVVDEVVICVDPTTTDRTERVIDDFENDVKLWPVVRKHYLSDTPLQIGFDEARNESIEKASGDWILWIDSDEYVSYPERLATYLCRNGLNGYGMKQHHFALEPVGVMKTDYPVRLFRNHVGVKFFGVVHEHPEIEMNDGVGHAWLIQDVDIGHAGYTNETVRRKRFERNIPLMRRDRDKYPDRWLGKFLWVRDLSQMIGYRLEQGYGIDPESIDMAKEGLQLWDELIEGGQVRMLVDGLGFYSRLVQTLGQGFEFSFKLDTNRTPGQTNVDTVQPLTGFFRSKEDALKFLTAIINERVKDYGHKYS